MRHARRATGLVLATVLGASLAACGGSDEPTTSGPTSAAPSSSTPSETASASASPSASATPTTPALSRFEGEPAVQAARAFARAQALDINAGDASYPNTTPLVTKFGRTRLDNYSGEDLKAKIQYPGPLPFTPLRLRTAGSLTTVVTCAWIDGWGLDRATQKPAAKRKIAGLDLVIKKTASGYKLNQVFTHDGLDCSATNVKGVPF